MTFTIMMRGRRARNEAAAGKKAIQHVDDISFRKSENLTHISILSRETQSQPKPLIL